MATVSGMEFLVLVVIATIVLMGIGGFIALASFAKSDQVVYAPHDSSGGLTTTTLVKGAGEHGYRLVQEPGRMGARAVVFEKTAQT